jgi:hypothetical protein
MALYPVQPGIQPLGLFDVLDTELATIKGGEVMTLGSAATTNSETETAAPDVLDGYTFEATASRPVAQKASLAAHAFVALADEGTGPDYFTMLGTVVGGKTGLVVSAGAVLGPHTSTASGKVTLWDKPGLYEVTLDAVASDFASSALVPGKVLGFTAQGKLQRNGGLGALADSGCAVFVEFSQSSSLVTTPARLVGGANAPDRVKIMFLGAAGKALT